MKNAFNACSRAALITQLEEEPTLHHLTGHAANTLAPHIGLDAGGRKWGESGEGFTQGNPESGAWFCLAFHKCIRKLDAALAGVGAWPRLGVTMCSLLGQLTWSFQLWLSLRGRLESCVVWSSKEINAEF